MAEYFDREDVGPAVNEQVAQLANAACNRQANTTKTLDRYKVPENYPNVRAPKVNKEIWSKLGRSMHARDFEFKEAQKVLGLGIVPLMQLTDKLMSYPQFPEVLRPLCVDTILLMGSAFQKVSHERRFLIRQALPKAYHSLCAKDVQVTEWLFGGQ